MRRVRAPRRSNGGFTLIELMVSLVMFSLTIAGVLSVAVTLTAGNREQRQTIVAESSVRAPMDFLADIIRQASPGVPGGINLTDASGATCTTGALSVINDDVLPDRLDVIYASGAVVTSSRSILTASGGTLDVSDTSQFAPGDRIVVADGTQGHMFKITSISAPTLNLGSICSGTLNWTTDYPIGSLVIRAQHAEIFIGTVDGIPTLMFDPDGPQGSDEAEPLAEGVEDMQIALAVETGTDSSILDIGAGAGDDEWQGNVAGEATLSGSVRAVRITLVSKAALPATGGVTPYFLPKAEDRDQGANDGYRRRVLRSTIEVRNMGDSP